MKIESINILNGPNYWSCNRQQLIDMTLDLQKLEEFPTDTIKGFSERLEKLIPSLYEHRCSVMKPGGFFERVRTGTWMGHVVEHIALEIQSLAGMDCGFGRTRSANRKGVYHVVFAYQIPSAGVYAAKAAVRIASALVKGIDYNLEKDIDALSSIQQREGLGPSTMSIIQEAKKRNIPFRRLNNGSLISLGYGINQRTICATMAGTTSSVGVEIASDKDMTRHILEKAFVPLPTGMVVKTKKELLDAVNQVGFPVVVKPVNGNHGRGVKVNILAKEQAWDAFQHAKKISKEVIVEKYIRGFDYRFLVINFKLQAVARRTPAMVTGDGKCTIQKLIDKTNKDPRRGESHEKVLTAIKVDSITKRILSEKKLTLQSILPAGEVLYLKDAANLSAGGTATDVTDYVHPDNVFMVERVARMLNLDICGIDMIAEDVTQPITSDNGAVIEVNAGPGFRMHLSPAQGAPRNVAEPVLKMLFSGNSNGRIPVIAVTGTNGKTTTTRLISHIAQQAGYNVGFTTTDGIFINGHQLYKGDCSGPASAESILQDPMVEFAVLECARGGILRAGLAFDKCDISIITNIAEDHLGLNGIDTLEDLARVKAVVAHSTDVNGFAILNADDDLVYAIKDELDCNVALFSTSERNERIISHCRKGGIAACIERGYFVICKGDWKVRIARVKEVPVTLHGCATSMIKNVLPSILAAAIRDLDPREIRYALMNFIPGPKTTPGRMNIFRFRDYDVMVDYAHNPHGFHELQQFMDKVGSQDKIGIVGCPGDRRDQDLEEMGFIAAQMFDRIIIRHDKDGRGRTNDNITELITHGIGRANLDIPVEVVSDEIEAIEYAMKMARPGAFIVVCSDKVQDTLAFLSAPKKRIRKLPVRGYQMIG
jgi:cyanophycin synthetase